MKATYIHPTKCNYCKEHNLDNSKICRKCKQARTIYHLELLNIGEDNTATIMFDGGYCQTVDINTIQIEGD